MLVMIAAPLLGSCAPFRVPADNGSPVRIYIPAMVCTSRRTCPYEMPPAIGEGEAAYSMKGLPADCKFNPDTRWLVIGPDAPVGTYRVFLVVDDRLDPDVHDEKPYDIIVKHNPDPNP